MRHAYLRFLVMLPGAFSQRRILLGHQVLQAEENALQMFAKPHRLQKRSGKENRGELSDYENAIKMPGPLRVPLEQPGPRKAQILPAGRPPGANPRSNSRPGVPPAHISSSRAIDSKGS